MSQKRKVLYLGHNLPYPPNEGALIRSYHTVRLLTRHFDVHALYFFRRSALPTAEERQTSLDHMRSLCPGEAFSIPQESSRRRLLADHLRSTATFTPYTQWAYRSADYRRALTRLLREHDFDLVHVDSIDLIDYLPDLEELPIALAHHNVESSLLRRRAEAESGAKRAYILHQARLVEQAERTWLPRVALNVAVSPEDVRIFERLAPNANFLVIPNGVDTKSFVPTEREPDGGMVFVGGYSWFPNADGMEFFAEEILPIIHASQPDVAVEWIGKAPREAVERFARRGIELLGYVDDIRPPMHHAKCSIVPLRVGGGTRLKILDAWALGKAVVSTSRGCEGLETRHGTNILIADEPREFAEQCLRVLNDTELRTALERGGRKTVEEHYDWDALGERMFERYSTLLGYGRKSGS